MERITGFHAHVYFDADQLEQATHLRNEVGRHFDVPLGRIHTRPIGPHTKGMFQILLRTSDFERIVPWLMLNRGGLDVLVHPETGDEVADHTRHALWLGTPQPINVDALLPLDQAH